MSLHAPALPYCRNCHFTLAIPRPRHCGNCGQETDLHPPSVREMFTEYLGHYIAFDGPLWRTLWALIALPGHLTNAYFHGARKRYVLPLRVYLSASFLFFVGSHLLEHKADPHADADTAVEQPAVPGAPVKRRVKPNETLAQASAAAASAAAKHGQPGTSFTTRLEICASEPATDCSATMRWAGHTIDKAQSMTPAQWEARIRALAPYGMLAMQPVFAALLLLMFAGSGRRYAEHFVFSLHSHSLWFLALLLAFATDLQALLMFAVFGHGLAALRNVYRLGWFGAAWRGLLLSACYFALLLAVAMAMAVLIASTA